MTHLRRETSNHFWEELEGWEHQLPKYEPKL